MTHFVTDQYSSWLQFAKTITLEAGEIVSTLYSSKKAIHFKEGLDGRPSTVTKADTQSEQHLVAALQKQFPDHGIYGEEGTNIALDHEYVWYIDPIDGTTNFWRHIPLFGISVGLTYQKQPVLGVLYFPALKLLVTGYQGGGAFANDKPIHVSTRSLAKSLYYVSCQELRNGLRFPSLAKEVGWIKAIDASSFEFAQIAMGDVELYTFFQKTPQDMVAGSIIIQEAGGTVTNEHGQPWTTDDAMIVASNGVEHQRVLELVKQDL